jgi:hypothetical protein
VILVSPNSSSALFQHEEILRAIDLCRQPKSKRRLVPIYLEGLPQPGHEPYGLKVFQAIDGSLGNKHIIGELSRLISILERPR